MSLSLCRHARARGHDVWLAYERRGDMVAAYERSGAHCVQVPVRPVAARRPFEAWTSFRSLRGLVRRTHVDLMFTSQVPLVPVVAGAAYGTGVRTVVHLGLVYDFPSPIFQWGMRAIDLGVAPSAHTAAGWRDRGWPLSALRVIENGVDDATFSPGDGREAARRRLGVPLNQPLIAYVGRLVAAKGIFTLVDAFGAYRRQGGAARLLLVGAAPTEEEAELHARARQACVPADAWEVRSPTAAPEDVYRAADVVVVPSEWDEPFGLVPLEAAACGTLAIVSDRGRLPEFVAAVGPCAVVRAGDAEELCARLVYWLADPIRREAAAIRLRTDVVDRFAFGACGDQYLDAFRELGAAS